MRMLPAVPPFPCQRALVVSCLLWLALLVRRSQAAQPTTDPAEVQALYAIFDRWGLDRPGGGGDPCPDVDVVTKPNSSVMYDSYYQAILCDCSYAQSTTCHVIGIKLHRKDVFGRIPEELANLTYLQKLYLDRNYLTGPLPPFIGNLSAMRYLSLSGNALSGTVPRELGNLNKLILLSLGTNNFSGPLPLELGNLSSLQSLYVDSNGFSGELPSTFAQLSNMTTFWAFDNNLSGKIPHFIGSWTKLTTLLLYGNNFQGPIPSSFLNLSSLIDLRLGDITDGSSPLTFIQNMKYLKILVLRNCKISGTILHNFDEYRSLTFLDLSFNDLAGQLPESLFVSNSLKYLFLGNNSLSGSLPMEKSQTLTNLLKFSRENSQGIYLEFYLSRPARDLSYNELSGRFPAWVSQNNLKLNLVANNFAMDATNYSKMPRGLGCLQQHNHCNHSTPIHSSFAVKCGGNRETINGIEYDADVQDVSVAAYYVTDTWAVSNTGYNPGQMKSVDSEYTARGSLSSLRYYGLGLENGCYSITLEFPEIAYKGKQTWRSLERRIFDIYIQGDRAAKDFNLRKEAGGLTNGPIVRKYKANVTDNFLEIHLFWSGKGTCCIPEEGSYGPLISSIYIAPWDLSQKKRHIGLYAGIVAGALALALSFISGIILWINKKKKLNTDEDEVSGFSGRVDTFSYAELKTATDGFNLSNKLGEGGFGPVFKGVLADGRLVAVKQLLRGTEQGKMQFLTEIATISSVQHRNLVKLYGYCAERDWRFLVYEYLDYKSLDQALYGKSSIQLDWDSRFGICLGTARGLAYLHGESTVRIIHRDVKSSNILIDADLKPKISDFGLARLYDDNKTHLTTGVAGTVGYLAPEYAMTGHLTEKVDVFGFGVVVLEVLSGKPSSSSNSTAQKVFLLEWAWHLHEKNCELEIVDPNLSSYNEEEAIRLFHLALLCTQISPMLRPSMSRALAMLTGIVPVPEIAARPGYYMTNLQAGGSSDCTSFEFSNSMMNHESTFQCSESNMYSCKSMMMGTSSSQTSTSPDNSLGSVSLYFTSSSHPLL